MKKKIQGVKIIRGLILFLLLAAFFDAWQVEPHRLVTHREIVPIPYLPSGLSGFKIAQITDLHLSHYGRTESLAIQKIREEKPDLIVLTGDYIGGRFIPKTSFRTEETERLYRDLKAPYGVWAILGNNDDLQDAQELQECGIHVLINRNVYIPVKNTGFHLVGVNSICELSDLTLGFAGIPQKDITVFLAHTPDCIVYTPYVKSGVNLALFGHTHGGQIRLPVIGPVFLPLTRDVPEMGAFRWKKTYGYTNSGLGMNWVPLRFCCPPEVAIFTFRQSK